MSTDDYPARAGETIADAVRHHLAPDRWTPLPRLVAAVGDRVPADQAAATAARLQRANGGDRTAADGAARVVQETAQHLIHRGFVEGIGRGTDRQYRLRGTRLMIQKRPKPRKEWLPLERLQFDARLQLRWFPDGKLFDEETVEKYREARQNGAEFPPIEVVEEVAGKKTVYWAFGGFHRGETFRRDGVNSVECLVYPGTFDDARFWALSQNSNHGRPRSADECRLAFDRLIDHPELLDRVMQTVKESGGVQRSLAAACGLSVSVVGKYLESKGLQADRKTGKLVPVPKPTVEATVPALAPAPIAPTAPAPAADAPPARATMPSAAQSTEPPPVDQAAAAKDLLANITRDLRSVSRSVEGLMRTKYLGQLRVLAKAKGHPFAVETKDVPGGVSGADREEKVEVWPVMRELGQLFADLSAQVYAG